ncbi:MAG: type II toxin-antitoxin system RelE/ParE family toxin [Deltaproteobacteria bacterium]|nr:type II toxin-antitoxin system RelE/ParE family toxin [Deltaproteobacteria bacterium]
MYRLDFSEEGEASFASLDRAINQQILNKLKWLIQNIDTINHKKLRGNLSGLYKLRIGDWRVIYEIDRSA